MPQISPRFYVFCISALFLCFGIAVAVLTFSGINVTTIHITGPLLICYAAAYLVCAPSGLWGILGASKNNMVLCSRYVRDHWFATVFLSIIEAVKLVFIFTLKDKTIENLIDHNAPYETEYPRAEDRVELAQKAAIVQVSIQETLLIASGIVVLYSYRNLSSSHAPGIMLDLEAPRSRPVDRSSITTTELFNQRNNLDIDHIADRPPSPFIHRPKLEKVEESVLESNKIQPHPPALKPAPSNSNISTNKIPGIQRSSERNDGSRDRQQQNQLPFPQPAPPIILSIQQQQQQSPPPLRRKRTQTFGSTRDAAPLDPPARKLSNNIQQQSRRRSKSTSAVTGLTVPTNKPLPIPPSVVMIPSVSTHLISQIPSNQQRNPPSQIPSNQQRNPPSQIPSNQQRNLPSQISSSNQQRNLSSSKRNSKRFSPRLSPIPEGLRRTSLPTQMHSNYSDLRHSSSLPNLLTQDQPYYDLSNAPPVPPLPPYLQTGSSAPFKPYNDNNISSRQSRNYQRNQNEPQKLQISTNDRYASHYGNSGDSPRSSQFKYSEVPFNQGPYQGRDNNVYSNTNGYTSSPKVRPRSMHSTLEELRKNSWSSSKYYNNQPQNNYHHPNHQRDSNYGAGVAGGGNVNGTNRNSSSRRMNSSSNNDIRGNRLPRADRRDSRDSRDRRDVSNGNNMIPFNGNSRLQGGYINQQPRGSTRENLMTTRYN
ncbi:9969_t:CDS:2 [Ambispora gerdemannii]|uniref:9969_t:CDS:1 n=1 Tax=Ambispora gerdemannii TaxID=144530 RepID=A0A9N8VQZ3_9GLOM|nr:9969_t:CDS:2 [Ambispora gerdemannii]